MITRVLLSAHTSTETLQTCNAAFSCCRKDRTWSLWMEGAASSPWPKQEIKTSLQLQGTEMGHHDRDCAQKSTRAQGMAAPQAAAQNCCDTAVLQLSLDRAALSITPCTALVLQHSLPLALLTAFCCAVQQA